MSKGADNPTPNWSGITDILATVSLNEPRFNPKITQNAGRVLDDILSDVSVALDLQPRLHVEDFLWLIWQSLWNISVYTRMLQPVVCPLCACVCICVLNWWYPIAAAAKAPYTTA